ncbi:hypothetical protein [Sinorhizobium saheli]|jgi:hypothetical protein|uniref:Uncharacterized protein n=1 Tax=Sinorhizobium saheli TaxID=36856 RepID=A0A178YHR0_SINSA|nr:hypothetical protein [Sinorhizobium saheli]MQW88904.1 hypothetical protein [Sinorhizobium saheli]OAP46806.1 hypothetical protein ATB98_13155 [Sinorhizobium saheli]
MTIMEAVLAQGMFARRNPAWQRLEAMESRHALRRLCALLSILAVVVATLEITGAASLPLHAEPVTRSTLGIR